MDAAPPIAATAAATHVAEWMLETALGTTSAPDAFAGMIERLRQQGLQIDRAQVAYTTLHPLNHGAGATWRLGSGLELTDYSYDRVDGDEGWLHSPVRHIVANRIERLRRHLAGHGAMLDFPVLETLAAEGLTDYILFGQMFDSFYSTSGAEDDASHNTTAGMSCSFATNRPSGFTDEEISTLAWLIRPLAMMVKMADQRQVAMNLADCYIGHEAGPHVLGGEIRRGDFASTPAVVWMSDLRASTEMSINMTRDEFIATINDFFDCTVGVVEQEGGEPLTFMGDGALAIFPIEKLGERSARRAAFAAAERATQALTDRNKRRRDEGHDLIRWGIALHAGTLEYGNIGSLTRHSWSAIGAVVNETARLEGTTKEVGEPIVASRKFVRGMDGDWRSMGHFNLKGVPGEFEVFAPPLDLKLAEETAA